MPVCTVDMLSKPGDASTIQPLLALAADVGKIDTDAAIAVGNAAKAFAKPVATIAVGGYFKSGKSSLLNAVIGRHLLPTNELPETGVACRIIPVGASEPEVAHVHFTDRHRKPEQIALTPEAISEHGGRLTRAGETRVSVTSEVERIEARLRGTGLPAGCHWLDTPGIGEDGLMDELAMRYALGADRLLWVLSSRSLLSTTEAEFLQKYIAQRGLDALTFVINAFLPGENAEAAEESWTTFCVTKLTDHLKRLREQCAAYELGSHPNVAVVAAKFVQTVSAQCFGGPELSELVRTQLGPQGSLVRRARVSVLGAAIADAIERVEHEVTLSAERLAEQHRAVEQARVERKICVDKAVAMAQDFIPTMEKITVPGVHRFADRLANQVSDTNFHRDATYQNILNEYVADMNAGEWTALKDLLNDEATRILGCVVHLPALETRVKQLLPKADLSIAVPKSNDVAMGKGALGGAAAGAALGSVIPFFGTILGAVGGAVVGGLGGAAAAVESDKQAASSIRSQIRSQLSALADRYTQFHATLHDEIGTYIVDGIAQSVVDPEVVRSHDFTVDVKSRLSGALTEARHLLVEYTRTRAFEIHKARNGGPGDEMSDWQQALREVYGRDDESGSEMNAVNAQNGSTMSPPLLAKVANWLHGSTEARTAIENVGGDVNRRSRSLGGNR
jgi:predicted GTPase